MKERLSYDRARNILFIDLSGLVMSTPAQVHALDAAVRERIAAIGRKVYAVINLDDFKLEREAEEAYRSMLSANQKELSLGTVRYSNQPLARTMLRTVATRAGVSSRMCAGREEALEVVEQLKREAEADGED